MVLDDIQGWHGNEPKKDSDSRFKDSKTFIVHLKNGNFSSVTHKMTVIKTLVNHIGPTVVNTQ